MAPAGGQGGHSTQTASLNQQHFLISSMLKQTRKQIDHKSQIRASCRRSPARTVSTTTQYKCVLMQSGAGEDE